MVHRERIPFARPFLYWPVALLIFAGVLLALLLPLRLEAVQRPPAGYYAILGFIAALFLLGCRWFAHLAVEAGPEGIVAGFGPLRRRIPVGRIEAARATDFRWTKYGGWGWRFRPGGEALSVFTTKRGLELLVRARRGRPRSVFISCREPERALEALRSPA
ncbi:MAG: hypothetical protein L0323_19760 [Planctomycetes bacterium]|nr:hypothetical protein [Planctomycetota bacterium]